MLGDRLAVEDAALAVRLAVVGVEDVVLGDGHRGDQPVAIAILGDVRDAQVRDLARRRLLDVLAGDGRSRPSRWCGGPTIASTSSVWPLPWTPAMATISPARTSRSTPLTAMSAVVADVDVLQAEDDLARVGRALGDDAARRRARPSGWRAARGSSVFGSADAGDPAAAQDVIWSATSRTSLSLWVMKMTVVPVAASAADDAEQLLGLGRGEHGRRLVEDEDVALAVERLEDLDPLADADGQVLDRRVGVDVEVVLLGQLDDALAGGRAVEGAEGPCDALGAERDRLDDVEHGHELEVLVDHADPGVDRLGAGPRRPASSPSMRISPESGLYRPDRMFIRVVLPAPFSPSRPSTSPRSAEIEIAVVGEDAREPLGDVLEFEPHRHGPRPVDTDRPGPRRTGGGADRRCRVGSGRRYLR